MSRVVLFPQYVGTGLGASERRRRADAALETVGLSRTSFPAGSASVSPSPVPSSTIPSSSSPTSRPAISTASMREAILDLLFELKRVRGATLVTVTHEPSYAGRCARQIRIKDGNVYEQRAKRAPQEAM